MSAAVKRDASSLCSSSTADVPAAKRLRSCAAAGGGRWWWSTLLPDLLVLILQRLPSVRDRIRFGCVCSWWRSVLAEARHLLPPTPPLLLLPYVEGEDDDDDLYPRHVHVHGIPIDWVHRILLPGGHDGRTKIICGSSMGWLLVRDGGGGREINNVHLWNPITREEIPLLCPLPCDFSCRFNYYCGSNSCVFKFVLSSNPACSSQLLQDCTVMVISKNTQHLGFCSIRDGSWTTLTHLCLEDAICYRGQFYAITFRGRVVTLDVGPNPKMTVVSDYDWYDPMDDVDGDDDDTNYSFHNYLVESSGELLRVTRIIKLKLSEKTILSTIKFVLHKLHLDTKTWSKVVSLQGDQALFLGSSSSVSVSVSVAAAATDHGYYKGNCIYFLDDSHSYLGGDMGVFDLEHGNVTMFRIDTEDLRYSTIPQFWIHPSPW